MKNIVSFLVVILLLGSTTTAWSKAFFDLQFSDNMVLPMNKQTKLFGTCSYQEEIKLGFRGELYVAIGTKNGTWEITINNGDAGGPFEISLYGFNPSILNNIQVGYVTLIFGNDTTLTQPDKVVFSPEEERKISFLYPSGRYSGLPVPYYYASKGWQKPSYTKQPILAAQLAKSLYTKYKIPIGIIMVHEKGAKPDSYMPNASLNYYAPNPEQWYELDGLKLEGINYIDYRKNQLTKHFKQWEKQAFKKGKQGFATPKSYLDASENFLAWDTIFHPNLNAYNVKQLNNGVYYLHKFVKLPVKIEGTDSLVVFVGRVYDHDSVWVNGKLMGSSTQSGKLRRYAIHEKELQKNGLVRLLIKVTSFSKSLGGIGLSLDSCILRFGQYRLEYTQIAGKWNYKQVLSFDTLMPPSLDLIADRPSVIYNGQIYPFRSFGIHSLVYALTEGKGNDWKILKGVSEALRTDFPNAQIATWYPKREETFGLSQLYAMPKNYWPIITYDIQSIHPQLLVNRLIGSGILSVGLNTKTQFPEIASVSVKKEKVTINLPEPLFVISKQNPFVFVITNSEGTSMETSDFTLERKKLTLNLPKNWKVSYLSYQIENNGIGSYLVNAKGIPLRPFSFNFNNKK